MSALGTAAYQGLALLAMLAHLVVAGLVAVFALYVESFRGTEPLTVLARALIVGVWCGLGLVGIVAWRERKWAVVLVPFLSLVLILVLIHIGIADVRVRF
jgi:hypothetical protein